MDFESQELSLLAELSVKQPTEFLLKGSNRGFWVSRWAARSALYALPQPSSPSYSTFRINPRN